jgi:Glycosyl hydrolase family 115/Gylcosyl hydrolase family 115 C-terminal domain
VRSSETKRLFFLPLLMLLSAPQAFALGEPKYVETAPTKGSFAIVSRGAAARIYVDSGDYAGVTRAVGDLQSDISRVTGSSAAIVHALGQSGPDAILIGTIGKSAVIDRLIREHKIDVGAVKGKWESTLIEVVEHPLPGVKRGLVMAGSDKRGTIFGIYDLSQQIGVSPWYWWADVPVVHKDALFVKAGRYVQSEPAVKYRGIFLNDEAPSLTGWVNATYGGFNHKFYVRVFELLLRLKANYLWPAMWNSAFNEDDPENPKLADEYGIVMGTSHHEPMLRAQQEWKRHGQGPWDYGTNSKVLDEFWEQGIARNKNYESTITLGMRGDGDMPMTEGANIALLEKIVAEQRKILAANMTPTLASNPKVWALYKEVQAYYEKGMRVPDDVTLLWCDDNWGNIRRLPTAEERNRPGGAGIYYHVDYVGDPRSYKWINTYQLPKIWEQMNLAYEYGADRIWILNVGDLKPMELPIEFFLGFAREPHRWNKDNVSEFTELWAEREFGPEHAAEIADLVSKYTKYNARRKPEQLSPETFSLIDYHEADRVLEEWQEISQQAEVLEKKLPAEQRDAFFELVLYPLKAAAIVNELYITAGKNHFYAKQGRASTNEMADRARELFKEDADLSFEYNHQLAGGKWNHMMDQAHLGYTFWNEPPANAMPAVTELQLASEGKMGIAAEGTGVSPDETLPVFDSCNRQTYSIDVFNRGVAPFDFSVATSAPWIVLNRREGTIQTEATLHVSVDWSKTGPGENRGAVNISQAGGPSTKVNVIALDENPAEKNDTGGFVEANGYISMEAAHFTGKKEVGGVHWEVIPDFGETLSAVTPFPVTAASATGGNDSAHLEYGMMLREGGTFDVEMTLAPTLNFVPSRGLRFALSVDDENPNIIDALEHNNEQEWSRAVSDGVRRVKSKIVVGEAGYHTLKVWMVDPGVVLEKIVVSQGPVHPSYLGPPESFRISQPAVAHP